jgi:hypothetical protein
MDIREVHAQHAVEVLERVAAIAVLRSVSKAKVPATDFLERLQLCMAPHISEDRNACIAEAAYFIAMYRGFSPGHELRPVDLLRSRTCTPRNHPQREHGRQVP